MDRRKFLCVAATAALAPKLLAPAETETGNALVWIVPSAPAPCPWPDPIHPTAEGCEATCRVVLKGFGSSMSFSYKGESCSVLSYAAGDVDALVHTFRGGKETRRRVRFRPGFVALDPLPPDGSA